MVFNFTDVSKSQAVESSIYRMYIPLVLTALEEPGLLNIPTPIQERAPRIYAEVGCSNHICSTKMSRHFPKGNCENKPTELKKSSPEPQHQIQLNLIQSILSKGEFNKLSSLESLDQF